MNKPPFSPDPKLNKVLRRLFVIAAYDQIPLRRFLKDFADQIESQQADDDLSYEKKVKKIRRRLA